MPILPVIPGVAISLVVAISGSHLARLWDAPATLVVLLIAMVCGALSGPMNPCREGLRYSSTGLLRVGVALIGLRLDLTQVLNIGGPTIVAIAAVAVMTTAAGALFARMLGLGACLGVLAGGAVGICGAAAAIAIAGVLPRGETTDRDLSLTIVGVTALSTTAMIAYPLLADTLHLSSLAAGVFLGGAIHDVAQVVGAGYAMSPQVGDTATIVKLVRVSMLAPIVLFIAFVHSRDSAQGAARCFPLPWFVIAFMMLMLLGSVTSLPAPWLKAAAVVSHWCVLAAIAALGMQTSPRSLTTGGFRPCLLLCLATAFIAAMVLTFIRLAGL